MMKMMTNLGENMTYFMYGVAIMIIIALFVLIAKSKYGFEITQFIDAIVDIACLFWRH